MIAPALHRCTKIPAAVLGLSFGITLALGLAAGPADAAQAPVQLGTAASFAVLGATTVTNIGPSIISGDLGVSPGSAVTGFPPGNVINGTQHVTDAVAAQAQLDVTAAYNDAFSRSPFTSVPVDLTGLSLSPGVYRGGSLGLSGTVTLDAHGNPDAVFVFQAASTLGTSTASVVSLIGGARACNVYWQIGSSATLGTASTFVGTVMALTSISAETDATVQGRLLARNGAVTLDANTISAPNCTSPVGSGTTSSSTGGSSTGGSAAAGSGTSSAGAGTGTGATSPSLVGLVPGAVVGSTPATGRPSTTSSRTTASSSPPPTTSTVSTTAPRTPHSRPPALTGSNLLPTTAAGLAALALGGLLMRLGRRSTPAKRCR